MLSKNREKEIRSLQQKKFRNRFGVFAVEGAKNLLELCTSELEVEEIFCTESFLTVNEDKLTKKCSQVFDVKESQLAKIGSFSTNNAGLAVVKIPESKNIRAEKDFVLVLDEVKDPGNLGTIIRTADWYGIRKIVCSENCVDVYNPKVINSTMGSFVRVNVLYTDLGEYFKVVDTPVFGAFLDGKNIYNINFPEEGYILMGNESKGISFELEKYVSSRVTIPRRGGAESLNVGIATAIFCDNVFR